jgi:transcriptional regulator with XRE-family HTH domain
MTHHPVDVHVGARLKMLRVQRGMSQTAVAESVGLTFQQIQKYENGSNRISASRLVEFASALGVPIRSFFEGLAADDAQPPALPIREPTQLDYEIVGLLSRVEDGQVKRQVRALLKALTADEEQPAPAPRG